MSPNRSTLLRFGLLALVGCGGGVPTAPAPAPAPAPAQVQALPSASTLPAPTLVASEQPTILFYAGGFGGLAGTSPAQPLEVAVWGDGRIVWRQNGSLLQGRVDPGKIDALLQRLHREGVFGSGAVAYVNYGPDSRFDVVELRLPDRTLKLESWHEGFEQNPNLVATSHGVMALEGRTREAVLSAEPAEYLRFRRIWSDIRSTVRAWTPAEAQPFTGTVPTAPGG